MPRLIQQHLFNNYDPTLSRVFMSMEVGIVLHGEAAQHLARAHGQTAVHTTQLLDYMTDVLRST